MTQRKHGVFLSYVALFINTGLSLLLIPFMLRALGQSDYGLYSIVGSLVGYLFLMDMGLSNTVIRFVAKYRANRDRKAEENFLATIVCIYVVVIIFILLSAVVLYDYLPAIFKDSLTPEETQKVSIMFIVLVVNISFTLLFSVFNGVVIAYECFVFQRSLEIIRYIARTILILVVLRLGYGVVAVVIVDTFCNIVLATMKAYYAFNKLNVRIKLHYLKEPGLLKEITGYSFFVFLNTLAGQIYWKIDNVILGIMTSSNKVAVYAIGSQLSQYYIAFSAAISNVFVPYIVDVVENDATGSELTTLMIRVGRLQAIVMLNIITGFTLFGKKFIALWAGPDYTEAYVVALIVMIPLTFLLIQNLGIAILEAKRKHWFRSVTMFLASIFNIGLTIALVRYLSITGAAIATAVGLSLGNIVVLNIYYHVVIGLDMRRFYKEVLRGIICPLLLSVIIGLGIAAWKSVSWVVLVSQISTYALVYCVLMWLIGMNQLEKSQILSLLKGTKERFFTDLKSVF